MKILLVKPYNISDHIQPSLGLGYLVFAVRDKAEVTILDCIKDKVDIHLSFSLSIPRNTYIRIKEAVVMFLKSQYIYFCKEKFSFGNFK